MLERQKLFSCNEGKYIYMLLSTLISCNFKFTICFSLRLTTRHRVHEKLVVTWLVNMCRVYRGTQRLVNCVQRILLLLGGGNEVSSVHVLPTYLINQIIFGVEYQLWRCSLYSFLRPLVMSPVLDPSIFHSTLMWNAFCLCSSPDVGDNFICTQNDKQNCSYVCFNLCLLI